MTKNAKLNAALLLAVGLLLGATLTLGVQKIRNGSDANSFGADPDLNLLIEDYIPVIRDARGLVTGLGILAKSTLRVQGTTTMAGPLSIQSRATTTIGSQGTTTYVSIGGVDFATVQKSYTATSGVVASIAVPFATSAASSTLLNAMCNTTSGIAGANTFDLATSTTEFGSSTPSLIRGHSVASLSNGDFALWTPAGFRASTTDSWQDGNDRPNVLLAGNNEDGTSPYVLNNSHFLNWKIASGTPGTVSGGYSGTCSANFMSP